MKQSLARGTKIALVLFLVFLALFMLSWPLGDLLIPSDSYTLCADAAYSTAEDCELSEFSVSGYSSTPMEAAVKVVRLVLGILSGLSLLAVLSSYSQHKGTRPGREKTA